jgi:hypothetical protein
MLQRFALCPAPSHAIPSPPVGDAAEERRGGAAVDRANGIGVKSLILAAEDGMLEQPQEVPLKRIAILLLLSVFAVPASHAQAPAHVRQTALARVPRARTIAADPALVQAVVARNSMHETLDQVRSKDREWIDNPQYALRKTLSTNVCAQRLREITKDDPVIVEAILMDAQGANVCVSRETSDYWQGDEPKFQKSFGADKEVFVDEPALDASTSTYAIQLTVIVFADKAKAGALTLTMRVPRSEAAGK